MKTVTLLGYNVISASVDDCSRSIADTLDCNGRQCRWMACLNPHSYAVARSDEAFSVALKKASWIIPDGIGIVFAGRALRSPLKERITGFDIFDGVMKALDKQGGSVFFLGGTQKNLDRIAAKLPYDYPNVTLAGCHSPPFKQEFSERDNSKMLEAISSARPDVLWVGLTAPKQEKWIADMQDELPVKFAGAIGAVFDFYTGQIPRSHPVFQRMGLEWFPRLLRQPRRLWRRMGISAPIFLWDVIRIRLSSGDDL